MMQIAYENKLLLKKIMNIDTHRILAPGEVPRMPGSVKSLRAFKKRQEDIKISKGNVVWQ